MNAELTSGFAVAARAYRRAMRRHEFSEPQWRLVDLVLFYSLERGEYRALIPRQQFFCELLGLRKGKVSEELAWLQRQSVIESGSLDRGWLWFGVLAAEGWRVPLRVVESKSLVELEGWLERVQADQPELIAAPASLNEALREVQVENGERRASRVEAVPAAVSSPGGNLAAGSRVPLGGTSALKPASEVPPGGTLSGRVLPQGTASSPGGNPRARVDSDRIIESRSTESRIESSRVGGSFGAYLEDRLFRLIGDHERNGRSGPTWRRALAEIPEELDELCGVCEDMKRVGRMKSPGAWMNVATRQALQMAAAAR